MANTYGVLTLGYIYASPLRGDERVWQKLRSIDFSLCVHEVSQAEATIHESNEAPLERYGHKVPKAETTIHESNEAPLGRYGHKVPKAEATIHESNEAPPNQRANVSLGPSETGRRTARAGAAGPLIPGKDFDPQTGEVWENGRPVDDRRTTGKQPEDGNGKIVALGQRAAQG